MTSIMAILKYMADIVWFHIFMVLDYNFGSTIHDCYYNTHSLYCTDSVTHVKENNIHLEKKDLCHNLKDFFG